MENYEGETRNSIENKEKKETKHCNHKKAKALFCGGENQSIGAATHRLRTINDDLGKMDKEGGRERKRVK